MQVCPTKGCPTLTEGGPCQVHQKARRQVADQARGSAQERGYDYQWSLFSKRWRERFPVCGMRADGHVHLDHSQCAREGRLNVQDTVTDHIHPLEQGGAKFDEANLQTLCRACNTRKDTGWGARRG
jgi:5-methylcytosine-specific restriction protein A